VLIWATLLTIAGSYSDMTDSNGSTGHDAVTRLLFCGHYFPASTSYTKEYLQSYPFIQVSYTFDMVLCKQAAGKASVKCSNYKMYLDVA
jgi:hypothetical protein